MFKLYKDALCFAEKAHRGQVRKYSGDPYILHPIRVANMVSSYTNLEELSFLGYISNPENVVAAAILHDTLEDCGIELKEIEIRFGSPVAIMVSQLSHASCFDPELAKKNRATRFEADIEKLSRAWLPSRLIKLCDRIDNLDDIPEDDDWIRGGYLKESDILVGAIKEGLPEELLEEYKKITDKLRSVKE